MHSPSLQANSCSTVQGIPCILQKPKAHYCAHESPLLVPTLTQMNPVQSTSISTRSILVLSYHLRPSTANGLLPGGYPTKTQLAFLFPPYMSHATPISSSLITSPKNYLNGWTNQDPHQTILSTLLLCPHFRSRHSQHCSQTPSVSVHLEMWQTKFHTHTKQVKNIDIYSSPHIR